MFTSNPRLLLKRVATSLFVLGFILLSFQSNSQVSLTFSKGYLGTQGSNTNQANNIKNLSTLGIARISFGQSYAGTFGGTQGNDLSGTIKIYLAAGATSSQAVNSVITLTGAINWRETTGSTVEVFGLIFDPGQNASISFNSSTYNIVGGSTANTSTTLGLKAYASAFTFTDGQNRSGNAATSGLISALNTELTNSPQPSTISLTTPAVVEGVNLVYTITLSSATTSGNPQVYTFSSSGTSTSGTDYNATYTFSNGVVNNGDGTITVPGGVSSFTVTVATTDDAVIETTETLILNIGSKSGTGYIIDNDAVSVCNTNNLYDRIISGYHSSIALTQNGTYRVWGSGMQQNGSSDQLAPQDINSTNYTGLTGNVLKAALGGNKAGAAVDQAIILTTTGLFAWGTEGAVLNNSLTTSAAFAKITSPSGANSYGLPANVFPTDIASMYATYQTLVIVTKIVNGVGGDVWIMTQSSLAVEGQGGAVGTAGTSTWKQVQTSSGVNLTGVVAVRGQNSSASYNAFMAQTANGQVYTWGNTTYLGVTTSSALNYATLMTLPQENGVNISPSMIGVTGGIGTTATTKNTYYILSSTGNLYALGDNTQKQCGDFTTTERTTWVRVKKSSTANDFMTNVKFISSQGHNSSYPGAAAITTSGVLYTWGNNSSGMLGRSDNGAVGGNLTVSTYDPGLIAQSTGVVTMVEMGGHTMVYLSAGTDKFCYVGHYTNGSMGDGTSGSNGSTSASTLTINCSTTPSISICGYVPVIASTVNSTISASPTSIAANGSATSTITVQLKDASGNNLTVSGGLVQITTTKGTISSVIDNGDGTYTAILTSSNTAETAVIGYTLNSSTGTNTTSVVFVSGPSPTITTSGTLNTFISCSGCTVAPQSFVVSGTNLSTNNLVVTAPTGLEVSTSNNSGFATSINIAPSAGSVTNTTVYVRLTSNATAVNSGVITVTSTGANAQTITVTTNTDNALNLDGTGDIVTIADNNALDLTTNYTIEAWIKPSAFTWLGGIVSKYHTNSSNGYILRLNGSGDYSGVTFDEMSTSNGVLSLNKWQHIAAVNNNGTRKIYINGVEQTITGTPLTPVANTDPVIIGQDFSTGGSRFFNGSIDEVRIWNTARSASEITSNMNASLSGTETGLVAYYNFNQGVINGTNTSITTLNDNTSNGLNGSISGVALSGTSSNFVAGFIPDIAAAGNATTMTPGGTLSMTNSLTGGVWSSANTSIATVNSATGLVTGVGSGTVSISYTICNKTVTYNVRVFVPTVTVTNNLKTFTVCSTYTLAPQAITVSGTDLSNNIVITAPTGYEISTNASSGYTSTVTLTQSAGTVSSTSVYIRTLTSNTTAGSSTLIISSTGIASQNITLTANADNALGLNGTSDYVSLPANVINGFTNFTFESWVYPTSSASWQRIFDFGKSSTTGYIFLTNSYGSNNLPRFAITTNTNTGEQTLSSSTVMPLNTWSHIAIVLNATAQTATMYLNGVQVATGSITLNPSSLGTITSAYIGKSFWADPYLAGKIDEVRIWNTARTASEIANNYQNELSGNEAGLVAYYNFNQGISNGTNTSITTTTDKTANNYNGTLNTFALTGTTSNFVSGSLPAITAAGNATSLNVTSTLQLSNTSNGGIWTTSNANIASVNSATGLVTGVAGGAVSISYTVCSKTVFYNLTVATPTITTTGTLTPFTVCAGTASASQSFTITATGLYNNLNLTAPAGYEIATSAGGTYTSSISLTPTSGNVSSTAIYVRLTSSAFNGDGGLITAISSGAISKTIATGVASVNQSVAARVTITSSAISNTICAGTSVTFTATAVNGGSTPTYQWKVNGVNVGTNTATYTTSSLSNLDVVTVVMSSSITSCVTGTPATSNAITINVNSVPSAPITINGLSTLCLGSNATYTINSVTGATSYEWVVTGNISATTSTSTALNIVASNVAGSGTVKVRAINACGASAYTSDFAITVSNTPAPTADFTLNNTEVCVNASSINFTNTSVVNSTTNSPITYYSWDFGDGSSLVNTQNANYNYTRGGNYNVVLTIQSADNCYSSISKSVIVDPLSVAGTAAAVDTVICEGTATTVNLTGYTGTIAWMTSPAGTNSWTTISGATSDVLNTGNLTTTTNYMAVVKSGLCSVASTGTITVTVIQIPGVSITPPTGVAVTDTTFQIAYVVTRGNPNAYTILPYGSSQMPNFTPIINYALRASPLTIAIPASARGNYGFSFSVAQLPYTCTAPGPPLTFTLPVGQGQYSAPAGLSYSSPNVYTVGSTITPLTPSSTGGTITSYSISPGLPAGLTFNTSTGVISGTPSAVSTQTTYIVTGTNSAGTVTATVVITVNVAPPAGLSYNSPNVYTVGSTITPLTPSSTGGPITSYSISPGLPAGLTFNTSTGVISGTPTAVSTQTSYVVTGTNISGTVTATVVITVNVAAPASLSYTTPNVYTVGTAITPLTPSSTGGVITSYSISPGLPAGLTFNTTTGVISGTPSAVSTQTSYVVTGTNGSGTVTATVVITVNQILNPPAPPTVQNGRYIIGRPGIPTSLTSFVGTLPTGIVPVWCNAGTLNCSTTPPVMPSAIGRYIYQVRTYDPATQLYSNSYASDTIIIAPPAPTVKDSTYVLGVLSNPSNIGVQVTGLSGATFSYFYLNASQSGTPALGAAIGTKRYTVSQTVNSIESDTTGFNVTILDPNTIIHLQKIVGNGLLQSDASFNYPFSLIVTNLTNTPFTNVVLTDNLHNSVPITSDFSVISNRATGGLNANTSFNGNSDINVTLPSSAVSGSSRDTANFVMNLIPRGFSGTLSNIAYVSANTKWGTITMQSTANSSANPTAAKTATTYNVNPVTFSIPEGFSPNHDGVNDRFVIIKPSNVTISIEVFNRWGSVVYSSSNYNNDWDGKGTGNFVGQDLLDGGYYYSIRAVDDHGNVQVFKGYIIIQR